MGCGHSKKNMDSVNVLLEEFPEVGDGICESILEFYNGDYSKAYAALVGMATGGSP